MTENLKHFRMRIPAISQLWIYVDAFDEQDAIKQTASRIDSKTVDYYDPNVWEIQTDDEAYALRQENAILLEALEAAIVPLTAFCAQHPKWEYDGVMQDPQGAHAALEKAKAALEGAK